MFPVHLTPRSESSQTIEERFPQAIELRDTKTTMGSQSRQVIALAAVGCMGKYVCEELLADDRFDVVVISRAVSRPERVHPTVPLLPFIMVPGVLQPSPINCPLTKKKINSAMNGSPSATSPSTKATTASAPSSPSSTQPMPQH